MNQRIHRNLIYLSFSSILLFGCSPNNNIDIDLSNLPKPKPNQIIDLTQEEAAKEDNQAYIKDLVPFELKEKLLSKYKFGKKDPFSENETKLTKLGSDFKLTGFLDAEIKKYAIVDYWGNNGSISEDSSGGFTTNLLPNGAKVILINTKEMKLKINYENEDYIFEL